MPWHPPSSWKDQTWESQRHSATNEVFTDIRDIPTNTARLLWTVLVWHFSESLICTWAHQCEDGAQPKCILVLVGVRTENQHYKYCSSIQVAKRNNNIVLRYHKIQANTSTSAAWIMFNMKAETSKLFDNSVVCLPWQCRRTYPKAAVWFWTLANSSPQST